MHRCIECLIKVQTQCAVALHDRIRYILNAPLHCMIELFAHRMKFLRGMIEWGTDSMQRCIARALYNSAIWSSCRSRLRNNSCVGPSEREMILHYQVVEYLPCILVKIAGQQLINKKNVFLLRICVRRIAHCMFCILAICTFQAKWSSHPNLNAGLVTDIRLRHFCASCVRSSSLLNSECRPRYHSWFRHSVRLACKYVQLRILNAGLGADIGFYLGTFPSSKLRSLPLVQHSSTDCCFLHRWQVLLGYN